MSTEVKILAKSLFWASAQDINTKVGEEAVIAMCGLNEWGREQFFTNGVRRVTPRTKSDRSKHMDNLAEISESNISESYKAKLIEAAEKEWSAASADNQSRSIGTVYMMGYYLYLMLFHGHTDTSAIRKLCDSLGCERQELLNPLKTIREMTLRGNLPSGRNQDKAKQDLLYAMMIAEPLRAAECFDYEAWLTDSIKNPPDRIQVPTEQGSLFDRMAEYIAR